MKNGAVEYGCAMILLLPMMDESLLLEECEVFVDRVNRGTLKRPRAKDKSETLDRMLYIAKRFISGAYGMERAVACFESVFDTYAGIDEDWRKIKTEI